MGAVASGRLALRLGLAALLSTAPRTLPAQAPDLARAGRWVDSARSALDSTTDSLRRPIALAYARLRRGTEALRIDPGTPVVVALACAHLTAGDTGAAGTALLRERDAETRGWLQARLVDLRALPWYNVRPDPSTVRATLAAADGIELPEARVNADLRLASAFTAIHDSAAARARLEAASAAYSQVTDTLRRVDQGMSIGWLEVTIGDPDRGLRLMHDLSRGFHRVVVLTGSAEALRARGLDPSPQLRESEAIAMAERRPVIRHHLLDRVIAGYDSVADSATIRRLRAQNPPPKPAAPTNLDRARARLAVGDTAGALRLAASYPDPRHLGHRAAALKRFGFDMLEGVEARPWRERAYRMGIADARRVRDAGMRAMLLYDLAYVLATMGDYATPGRDARLREAEQVAAELPPKSRIGLLQAVAEGWAWRSDSELQRILGLMPTRADSAQLLRRVVQQVDIASRSPRVVDSVRRSAHDQLTEMIATATLFQYGPRPGVPAVDLLGLLARLTLPKDADLLPGLLRAKAVEDTLGLEQWARQQPTALARVIAYQALATDAMYDGRIWSGWPGCFDD